MSIRTIIQRKIQFFAVGFALTAFGVTADRAQAAEDCSPVDGTEFLCGVTNMEQLVGVDGTRWAVGSSAAGGAGMLAPIYFLNLDTQEATPLDPTSVTLDEDKETYPGCPGPADLTNLQSLGVEHEKINGRDTLIVISHGGAFTMQIFEMSFGGDVPALSWKGCVLPPDEHFWPDAAAALPDGGFLVTSLFDPTDANVVASLTSGKPYGSLGEWHPGTGWTDAYPGTFAGPNGVILSEDYNMLFVANWSGKSITRIDRSTGEKATVEMGMLVDNLIWNEDRSKVLAGGQTDSIEKAFAECVGSPSLNCDINFALYEIDPVTLEKKLLFGPGKMGVMGAGTGVLQDGDTLWVTSYRSDRVARIAYPQ